MEAWQESPKLKEGMMIMCMARRDSRKTLKVDKAVYLLNQMNVDINSVWRMETRSCQLEMIRVLRLYPFR